MSIFLIWYWMIPKSAYVPSWEIFKVFNVRSNTWRCIFQNITIAFLHEPRHIWHDAAVFFQEWSRTSNSIQITKKHSSGGSSWGTLCRSWVAGQALSPPWSRSRAAYWPGEALSMRALKAPVSIIMQKILHRSTTIFRDIFSIRLFLELDSSGVYYDRLLSRMIMNTFLIDHRTTLWGRKSAL